MRAAELSVAIVLCCLSPAAAAGDLLASTSSRDHAWFIVDRSAAEPRFELYHHARTMDGPYSNKGLPLPRMPRAMAAWGHQLWLVFDDAGRREVFTVQVHRNPVLQAWQHRPPDRLRAVTRLDTPGRIVDAAGSPEGPLILLRPSQRARAGVRAADGSVAAEPTLDEPKLLRLEGRRWRTVPLPDGFDPTPGCRVVGGGPRGRRVLLLDEAPEPGLTAAWWRDADGEWSRSRVPVAPGRLLEVTRIGPAVALVLRGGGPDRVEVAYLRPWQLLPLAGFSTPGGPWTVLGLAGGPLVVELADGRPALRRIDPVSGDVGPSRPMEPQPVMTARVLHRPMLFALAITALMVVLLFRPDPAAAAVSLPPALDLMRPMSRLLAVTVDLAVSAGLTLVILRCPPRDLLDLPLWSADLAGTVPFLVVAAITILHSTVSELATGRTLGKALLRGRVVGADGSRPTAAAILARNGFKLLVLLIPVLAVAVLLNPNAQGLGDSVARTVVVTSAGANAARDGEDR